MIAFQPDPSFLSSTLPNAGALPQPEANPGGGAVANNRAAIDFAGLVNAALPSGKSGAGSGAARGALAGPNAPAPAPALPADIPAPPVPPINAPTLVRELPHAPGGIILPGHGVSLPPQTALAPVPVAVARPAAAPVSPLHDQAEVDGEAEADEQLAAEPMPDPGVLAGLAPLPTPAPTPTPAPAPATPPAVAVAAAAPQPASAPARNPAAPARSLAPGARQGGVEAGKGTPQAGPKPIRAEHAALPAAVPGDVLTALGGDARDTGSATSNPAPTPTPAVLADPAPAPDALAPDASAPAPSAQPTQATPAPAADRSEPRAPSPQQESTIAAVGELREALRAARPELTLRHAEFGPVSLRLEQVAGQDWRAVLASRDPGFVPAIQAALSERAITAAAESANTNANTNGNTGQNGASDQRYGASPNGGQGSSQPYLAQSSNRDDGGQNHGQPPSQQRQPRTTDTVAARAGDSDAARADPRDRGVFA